MAISSLDQLVTALATNGFNAAIAKEPATSVAGTWQSLWGVAGAPSAQTSLPAVGSIAQLTSASIAGFVYNNPTGTRKSYAAIVQMAASAACGLLLYDRLCQMTYNGNSTTATTFTGATVNRPSGGAAELWVETATAIGVSNAQIDLSYVNSAGTTIASQIMDIPSLPAGGMFRLPIGSDGLVRQVLSAKATPSRGTGNNVGLVLLRPIAYLSIGAPGVVSADFSALGLPELSNDLALGIAALSSTTTTPRITGQLRYAHG